MHWSHEVKKWLQQKRIILCTIPLQFTNSKKLSQTIFLLNMSLLCICQEQSKLIFEYALYILSLYYTTFFKKNKKTNKQTNENKNKNKKQTIKKTDNILVVRCVNAFSYWLKSLLIYIPCIMFCVCFYLKLILRLSRIRIIVTRTKLKIKTSYNIT